MSWNKVKLQTRTTNAKLSVSLGTPSNPSSSSRVKVRPDTRGALPEDRINTDGVLSESDDFSPWIRFHKGGINTLKVHGNTLCKLTGCEWSCGLGKYRVTKGKARFEMLIKKKTGPVQVGLASVGDSEWLGDCFGDDNFAGKAWYISSSAKVCAGGSTGRSAKSRNTTVHASYQRAKGDPAPELAEGDVVGIAVNMDEGTASFYKIREEDKGKHVFASPCYACSPEGLPECRVWNERRSTLGMASHVMTYPDTLLVGNLPAGEVLEVDGSQRWVTGFQDDEGGEVTMESHIKRFFSEFGVVGRVVTNREKRTASVWLSECDCRDEWGMIVQDPKRAVLQSLARDDCMAIPQGHVFLNDWCEQHAKEAAHNSGGDRGGCSSPVEERRDHMGQMFDSIRQRGGSQRGPDSFLSLHSFHRTTSKEYDGPRENIGKAGPYISAKPHRGHVTPGACLCQAGTEVELRRLIDAVDEKRDREALKVDLEKFGIADSLWSNTLRGRGLNIIKGRVTKVEKLPYFSTVLGSTYISRRYPPEGWMRKKGGPKGGGAPPGYDLGELVDGQFPQDGWRPHNEGRWHAEAGGKWTFTKNGHEYGYLNKRCWEVTIKQLGVWGKTYSSGICIGVASFPVGGETVFDLEHSWRWALHDDLVWYLDCSNGFDHLNKATGGCMYNGQKKIVPQFITGVKGGLVEGDVVSIEVDMGWQKWDYDDHAMVPMGKTFDEGGRTALEIMEPGSFRDTVTMLNFAVNGRQVGGRVLEPNLLGGDGEWPVHPAVCLQGVGDCVELKERHWSTWPCPHSAFSLCPRCQVIFGKD